MSRRNKTNKILNFYKAGRSFDVTKHLFNASGGYYYGGSELTQNLEFTKAPKVENHTSYIISKEWTLIPYNV